MMDLDKVEEVVTSSTEEATQVETNTSLSLKEIQSWWKVAAIVHFSSVFRPPFNLPEFEFNDFEDALLKDKPGEENLFLLYLTIDLLKGCLGIDDINFANFNKILKEFVDSQFDLNENSKNLLVEGKQFNDLETIDKVSLINAICDYRLVTVDAAEKTTDVDADSLRIEPLGTDSSGTTYWYFYGTRLYKEGAPKSLPPTLQLQQKKEKSSKKSKRKKHRRNRHDSDDFEPDWQMPSEIDTYGDWSLAATTLSEWQEITDSYKDSKNNDEKELYLVLSENFLPILPNVFEAEEQARMKKLKELESTRQSSRLEEKRKEQEMMKIKEEEMRRNEEIQKREALKLAAKIEV